MVYMKYPWVQNYDDGYLLAIKVVDSSSLAVLIESRSDRSLLMVTSNMQHAIFEWEYFTWRILLMILSLPLSLCGCRFILRFRMESKLKSEAAYYFT